MRDVSQPKKANGVEKAELDGSGGDLCPFHLPDAQFLGVHEGLVWNGLKIVDQV